MSSLFAYDSVADYLHALRASRVGKRPLTLEKMSSRLGYRSPRTIAMVLKNQRKPSQELVDRLVNWQKLSLRERDYLSLLVQKDTPGRSSELQRSLLAKIKELKRAEETPTLLRESATRYTSEWYYRPLRQLVETPSFKEDLAWISKKLKGKISPMQVGEALQRLVDLKLLTRTADGKLKRSDSRNSLTTQDIPSRAIQDFHLAMLARAQDAVTEELVANREFFSTSVRVEVGRLPEIKEFVRKFHAEFLSRFESDKSDDVFQVGTQVFKHTR